LAKPPRVFIWFACGALHCLAGILYQSKTRKPHPSREFMLPPASVFNLQHRPALKPRKSNQTAEFDLMFKKKPVDALIAP
jgi:hypothetical protein